MTSVSDSEDCCLLALMTTLPVTQTVDPGHDGGSGQQREERTTAYREAASSRGGHVRPLGCESPLPHAETAEFVDTGLAEWASDLPVDEGLELFLGLSA